jgi:ribosomal protein L32/DNA-binding PadR family transcriptional regulator
MADESTDEMILADLMDVLCDFTGDADQCLNPWSDETLAPLRALAERLRRWHRPYSLGDHRPRPQAVTIGLVAVLPEDTTIALADARYVMIGDLIVFGGEIMEVTAAPDITTNFVAVARGLRGTVAAGHAPYTVGFLIGNTRTGGEIIDPPSPTVLSGPDRRRMRDDAERAVTLVLCPSCGRGVRPGHSTCRHCGADMTPPAPDADALDDLRHDRLMHGNIDAAIRRLEAETTEERARAEADQPPCKFDTPEGRAELERMRRDLAEARHRMAYATCHLPTRDRIQEQLDRIRANPLYSPAMIELEIRRLEEETRAAQVDGELTPGAAAERLRLLDELEGRVEGE